MRRPSTSCAITGRLRPCLHPLSRPSAPSSDVDSGSRHSAWLEIPPAECGRCAAKVVPAASLRQPIRLSIKRLINKNASAFAAVIQDLSPGLGCSTNSDRVYLSEPADWLATGRMGVEADEEEVAHRDEPITRRIERGATAPQNAPNTTHGFRSMDATEMINATGHL